MAETEFQKVEGEVKAFEKVLAQKIARAEDAIEQKLSTDEELSLRRLETEFLKLKIEIETLNKRAMEYQQNFGQRVGMLAMKYDLDPTKWSLNPQTFVFAKQPVAAPPAPPDVAPVA
jgi:hypothetical protein